MLDPGGARGGHGQQPQEEVKTQFLTREGLYVMQPMSEYSRPNRVGYANPGGGLASAGGGVVGGGGVAGGQAGGGGPGGPAPVRVSFSVGASAASPSSGGGSVSSASLSDSNGDGGGSSLDKIAFNYGREIFVYPYRGLRKAADLTKPLDKRIYKGTCPTCHDFGAAGSVSAGVSNGAANSDFGSAELTPLLVGFTQGQIQLVDPVRKELSKLYNEERLIDKSRVTCIKWIPGSPNHFLAGFSSGCLYVFNHELSCPAQAPVFQPFKQGDGFVVYTSKAKSTRNPLYKWSVGSAAVNEFAFSPCGHFLAVASQDCYLRIFNYDTMELVGIARSYFGGVLCVCWSPDGKYVVFGGEDDLITIYSMSDKRVVARGQGHKSWVTRVAFDKYNMSYGDVPDGLDFSASDEEEATTMGGGANPGHHHHHHHHGANHHHHNHHHQQQRPRSSKNSSGASDAKHPQQVTCYRLGSVGEDTLLCLWDLTEDLLRKTVQDSSSALGGGAGGGASGASSSLSGHASNHRGSPSPLPSSADSTAPSSSKSKKSGGGGDEKNHTSLSQRLASLNLGGGGGGKEHKRNFSLTSSSKSDKKDKGGGSSGAATPTGSSASGGAAAGGTAEYVKLGSIQCPRLNDVPLIEPLVGKKVSHERLTALAFLEDSLVTACQDGYVCTWARPGKGGGGYSNMMCPGSPPPSSGGGGTIV